MSQQEKEKSLAEIFIEIDPEFRQQVMARMDLVHLINHLDQRPAEIQRFVSQWDKDWPKFLTETFMDRVIGVPAVISDEAIIWGAEESPTLEPGDYGSSRLSDAEDELYKDLNSYEIILNNMNFHNALHRIPDGDRRRFLARNGSEPFIDVDRRRALVARYGNESFVYEPTPYDEIRDIQSRIQVDEGDVVYDLGSGYGRFVLFGALTTPARYKGIEIVEQRAETSTKAAKRLSIPNIEIVQGNVRDVEFSDGTIFYMFDPFCPSTERIVRNKVRSIGTTKPIIVITKGDVVDMAFANQSWLKKVDEVQVGQTRSGNFIGTRIYKSTPVVQAA